MKRRFVTLDVFTEQKFAGNPLAVVLDPEGLDTGAMQTIAREFNLSETVFVWPPEAQDSRARLRIFTPGIELPFAGHPTVGTAVLLGRIDGGGSRSFTMVENVGRVPCVVRSTGPDSGHATFDIPRLPERISGTPAASDMAAALGLSAEDLGLDDLPTETWSAGNPFTFTPLANLDAMARCRINIAKFEDTFGGAGRAAAFVFCRETRD